MKMYRSIAWPLFGGGGKTAASSRPGRALWRSPKGITALRRLPTFWRGRFEEPSREALVSSINPLTLEAGTLLGPYRVLAPIGAGGMGEVYRARDTKLDRDIALKILPPDVASVETMRRFEKE